MTKIITTIAVFICSILSAQQFEAGMGQAMKLWGEGKNNEASALFERIAAAEKNNYLPNYYVAMVNTSAAFTINDKQKINDLLTKAQTALDTEMAKDQKNSELYCVQALIHTAWIVSDPMTNGMKLSAKTMETYEIALKLDPNNPRAVFGKADFAINGAKWTGADTKPLCIEVERSIALFENFKPSTPFAPTWGIDRAKQALANCSK
jgi:hypothetical protein